MPTFLRCSRLLAGGLSATAFSATAQAIPTLVQVVDSATARPLPYTSVGVPRRALGTIANAQGSFVPARIGAAATDTLVVSCVGYRPRRLLAGQLAPVLRMAPQPAQLAEVVVRGTQARPVVLGHRGVSSLTAFGFYTQADTVPHARLGREFGVLLHVRHPTQLRSLHLFTSSRQFRSVTFRLNLYAVRGGQPPQQLPHPDIVFTVRGQQRGWTVVNLQPYALALAGPQDVVAAVQWVDSEKNQPTDRFFDIPVHLSATHTSFRRDKSAQAWTKLSVNPSLYFVGVEDVR